MKKLLILLITLFSFPVFAADEGKQLYEQYCAVCHRADIAPQNRVAPALFMVRRHYIGSYPDELSFINAVADWVETRDPSTSLMPGAVRRYGIMPEIVIEREKVEKIAAFIFGRANETPPGFEQHYRQRHGL